MAIKKSTLAGRHAAALNSTRDGLRILAALALTLTLLGANPSWTAQADNGIQYNMGIDMNVDPTMGVICLNESIEFAVMVGLGFITNVYPNYWLMPVSGVNIDATVVDTSIGTISPDRQASRLNNDLHYNPRSQLAAFTFKAGNKPGTTAINFNGLASRFSDAVRNMSYATPHPVASQVEVEVRKCNYLVTLIMMEYEPDNIWVNGHTIEPIKLNAVSDNHLSGTGDILVEEKALFVATDCNPHTPPPNVFAAQVKITADLVGDKLQLAATTDHVFGLADFVPSTPGCVVWGNKTFTGLIFATGSVPSQGGTFVSPQGAGYNYLIIVVPDRGQGSTQ